MVAWNVYVGSRIVDTVFYVQGCDAEWVRRGLVEHDNYSPSIRVMRAK